MSDPDVQKALAGLMASESDGHNSAIFHSLIYFILAIATIVGVLATLTTVPWGEASDRRGRTLFLGLAAFISFLAFVVF